MGEARDRAEGVHVDTACGCTLLFAHRSSLRDGPAWDALLLPCPWDDDTGTWDVLIVSGVPCGGWVVPSQLLPPLLLLSILPLLPPLLSLLPLLLPLLPLLLVLWLALGCLLPADPSHTLCPIRTREPRPTASTSSSSLPQDSTVSLPPPAAEKHM